MNTQTLYCFIAVAEEKNLDKAAVRLALSPEKIVQHIRSLEQELELALFTEYPSLILLSAAGAAFLPHAHGILMEFELAKQEIRRISELTETR